MPYAPDPHQPRHHSPQSRVHPGGLRAGRLLDDLRRWPERHRSGRFHRRPGLSEQTRQAVTNLRACLDAAGASPFDVVKLTILCVEGAPLREDFAAFGEAWQADSAPPAITVAFDGLSVKASTRAPIRSDSRANP
jgi:Endoribonuclease L-PSP